MSQQVIKKYIERGTKLTFNLKNAKKISNSQKVKRNSSLIENLLTKIATKKPLKDLINNDVENIYDLYLLQKNKDFETFFSLKDNLTNPTLEKLLTLFYNGLLLSMLEKIQLLDINKEKFPKLWDTKISHLYLWLQNILKSINEQFAVSLLENFLFEDLKVYLIESLFKNKFYPKKLVKFSEELIKKKYTSVNGETDLLSILSQVKKTNGNEKMVTFLFVQIFQNMGINMSVCMSCQGTNRKKKVKLYDSYKNTDVTVDLVLILINNGNNGFSLCFGLRSGTDSKILSGKKIKKLDNSDLKKYTRDPRSNAGNRRKYSEREKVRKEMNNYSLFETFDHRKDTDSIKLNSSYNSIKNNTFDYHQSNFSKRSKSPLRNTKNSLENLKYLSEDISQIKSRIEEINRVKVHVLSEENKTENTSIFNTRKNSKSSNNNFTRSGGFYVETSNIFFLILNF